MHWIVVTSPGCRTEWILPALEQVGFHNEVAEPVSLKSADWESRLSALRKAATPSILGVTAASQIGSILTTAAKREDIWFLLVYASPGAAVREALAAGRSLENGIAEWQREIRHTIRAVQRNRERVVLLHQSALIRNGSALCAYLDLLPTAVTGGQGSAVVSLTSDLEQLVLAQWAYSRPDIAELSDQLAALTPLALQIGEADEGAWLRGWKDLTGLAERVSKAQTVNESLERTNGELEEQLHKVKTELETCCLKAETLQVESDQFKKQNENFERQWEKVNSELREDNRALEEQLHKVQKELESYFLKNETLNAQSNHLKNENKALQQEWERANGELREDNQALEKELYKLQRELESYYLKLEALKKTRSWRVTSPLRAIGSVVRKILKILNRGKR